MTETVVIALPEFLPEAGKIARFLAGEVLPWSDRVFAEVFPVYRNIVAVMASGIVVRGIAPLLGDKWADPAVVVVSPDLRFAVPLTGGHHGANDLAYRLADLGIIPVITTATEATGKIAVENVAKMTGTTVVNKGSTRNVNAAVLKNRAGIYWVEGPGMIIATKDVSFLVRDGTYAIGIGCRKGAHKEEIVRAVDDALSSAGLSRQEVFVYATTGKKLHEPGLREAMADLAGCLIFLDDDTINRQAAVSPSAARRLGLAGVAEPCALAVAKRGELVLEKKIVGRVTVAIAR